MDGVHDSNPNLPRRLGRPVDEVASLVLDYLIAGGGEIHDEPGELLKRIARECDCDYFGVTIAVRMLESIEFVRIERSVSERARRGNRIIRIELL